MQQSINTMKLYHSALRFLKLVPQLLLWKLHVTWLGHFEIKEGFYSVKPAFLFTRCFDSFQF